MEDIMADESFIHRWFEEVWNQKSEAAVDELLAEDGVGHGLPGGSIQGPEAFKEYQRNLLSVYPDLRVIVEDTVTGRQDRGSLSRDRRSSRRWFGLCGDKQTRRLYGDAHRPRQRRPDHRGMERI
jgi:hypothetical protein